MEWTRVPTDLIFQGLTDNELVAIIKYQILWAKFEREPDEKTTQIYMTQKQIIIAKSYHDSIKMLVTSDIDSINKKRKREKKYYEKQTLNENSNVTDKIRLDKIILDKKEKENKKKKNYDAEFEEWWKICPKKVEKDKAFNKFKSILAEKKATVDELIDGMNRYLQKCIRDNTEDHYIKHPTTWLNGGCWKDDYNAWKNIDDKVPKSGGIGEWDKTPETYTVGDY